MINISNAGGARAAQLLRQEKSAPARAELTMAYTSACLAPYQGNAAPRIADRLQRLLDRTPEKAIAPVQEEISTPTLEDLTLHTAIPIAPMTVFKVSYTVDKLLQHYLHVSVDTGYGAGLPIPISFSSTWSAPGAKALGKDTLCKKNTGLSASMGATVVAGFSKSLLDKNKPVMTVSTSIGVDASIGFGIKISRD